MELKSAKDSVPLNFEFAIQKFSRGFDIVAYPENLEDFEKPHFFGDNYYKEWRVDYWNKFYLVAENRYQAYKEVGAMIFDAKSQTWHHCSTKHKPDWFE